MFRHKSENRALISVFLPSINGLNDHFYIFYKILTRLTEKPAIAHSVATTQPNILCSFWVKFLGRLMHLWDDHKQVYYDIIILTY